MCHRDLKSIVKETIGRGEGELSSAKIIYDVLSVGSIQTLKKMFLPDDVAEFRID